MNVELPETLVILESVVYKSNGFAIEGKEVGIGHCHDSLMDVEGE
jgi:hypothetical protein